MAAFEGILEDLLIDQVLGTLHKDIFLNFTQQIHILQSPMPAPKSF